MRTSLLIAAAMAAASGPLVAKPLKTDAQRLQQISEVVFQNYPGRALAAGEQGPVYFLVRLDEKAQPRSCVVTHSSGYPLLDAETCDLIVQHATFKSLLGPNGKPTKSTHEGVVNWRIPGTPQPPINPIPVTVASAPEKQICKRTVKTGTLSGFNRQCMTQREWDAAARETQDHWGEYQGRAGQTRDPGLLPGPIGSAPPTSGPAIPQ